MGIPKRIVMMTMIVMMMMMTWKMLEDLGHWQALPLQDRREAHKERRQLTRKPPPARIRGSWKTISEQIYPQKNITGYI